MISLNFLKKLKPCMSTVMILSSFMSCALHAQPYYKWIDAKGSTHYTRTPPPKGAKKQGQVETYGSHTSTQVNTLQAPSNQQNSPLSTPVPPQSQPTAKQENTLPATEPKPKTQKNIATPSATNPSL